MKKTYKNPTMVVVKLQARHQMMAGSPGLQSTGYNSESEVLSRESYDWDEE
jgi:hypothetical protein